MLDEAFRTAQSRMLERFGINFESRFVDVAVVSGRAQVLVSGRGPAVLMLNGIGSPAAMWAPLIARIEGFTLYAVDLPGYGLTDTTWEVDDGPSYRAAAELAPIAQPTMLIWGKDDPMGSPAIDKRAAEAIPDAELVVVEGGHAPWLKQAARPGPMVSAFLSESSGGQACQTRVASRIS